MTTMFLSTIEAKEEFSDLLSRVSYSKERIVLTRRDKEIAVLIPMEDWADLKRSQTKQLLEAATNALKEARAVGFLTLEFIKDQTSISS